MPVMDWIGRVLTAWWMDRFELYVSKPRPNQNRQTVVGVQGALQGRHTIGHGRVGRRHEGGRAGASATDPVP